MTIACGLAWSNALMSIGQFILAGNWLLEADFIAKWERSKRQKHLGLLLSFLGLVLIGFLWSSNLDYALKDGRIKFPLFLMPLFIGTSERLSIKEVRIIFSVYLITLLLLYLSSLTKYFGIFSDAPLADKRELSIFVSHIRYGLNLILGTFIVIQFSKLLMNERNPASGLWPSGFIPFRSHPFFLLNHFGAIHRPSNRPLHCRDLYSKAYSFRKAQLLHQSHRSLLHPLLDRQYHLPNKTGVHRFPYITPN